MLYKVTNYKVSVEIITSSVESIIMMKYQHVIFLNVLVPLNFYDAILYNFLNHFFMYFISLLIFSVNYGSRNYYTCYGVRF